MFLSAMGFALAAANPQLGTVHSVYLLPMSGSLDQYLANRVTQLGLMQVVTDPQKADAVFTDRIGEGFEQKMTELYPPPPEVSEKDKDKDKDAEDKKDDNPFAKPAQHIGNFSKGRGTIFLVDRQSRNVIWSTYLPVRNTQPEATHRRADEIADRLRKDLKVK